LCFGFKVKYPLTGFWEKGTRGGVWGRGKGKSNKKKKSGERKKRRAGTGSGSVSEPKESGGK